MESPYSIAHTNLISDALARQSGAICGCCGSTDVKLVDVGVTEPVEQYYCRDHYVHCLHTPGFGPNGEDWDSDEPGYIAAVARLEAEWDAL